VLDPVVEPIIESQGLQEEELKKKLTVKESIPELQKILNPVVTNLKIGEILGEIVTTIAFPELTPLLSLKSSLLEKKSASDTVVDLAESLPLALAGTAGKLGKVGKLAASGAIISTASAGIASDIKKKKPLHEILENAGIKLSLAIPAGREGTKVALAIKGLKGIAEIGNIVKLRTDEKEKVIIDEEDDDMSPEDRKIRDLIDNDKEYKTDALELIQDHIERTDYEPKGKLKKQLNDLRDDQELGLSLALHPTSIYNKKDFARIKDFLERYPDFDVSDNLLDQLYPDEEDIPEEIATNISVIKPVVLPQVIEPIKVKQTSVPVFKPVEVKQLDIKKVINKEPAYKKFVVDVSYPPVIFTVPDYTGQVELYHRTPFGITKEDIDCSRLVGQERKRCEHNKKKVLKNKSKPKV